MNFQSILAFIFIAAISSLFNNKKQPPARDFKGAPVREARPKAEPEPPSRQNLPKSSGTPSNAQDPRVRQQPRVVPKAGGTRRPQQRPTASLEDFIGGLRRELQDVFGEFTSNTPSSTGQVQEQSYLNEQADQRYVEEKRREFRKGTEIPKTKFKEEDPIYQNEIGSEEKIGTVSFDRKSVIQGIIMAEVLGKPKALRK